ncbi:MAG TPA: hypothetical protein VMD91_08160 [Candidatus Sulfotelmatobacter sp.]|nr:hypothetical protein [Candidatus Sulfotelmatobacter sp.]
MAGSGYDIYVTFSGESKTPVKHVRAYGSDGKKIGRVTPDYDELRGMTLDLSGRFYLAVAYESVSEVLLFSATVNKDGTRDLLATLVTPATSSGIAHPYGLAFDGSLVLFVSSQDTNCVTAFAVGTGTTATPAPIAAYLTTNFPSTGPTNVFYPGQWVASVVPIAVGGNTPPAVPAAQGGLAEVGLVSPLPPPSAALAAAGAKKPTKHSVRGVLTTPNALYAVDEAANRVCMYELGSGAFTGAITGTGGTGKHDVLDDPVGLAYEPAAGVVYIGSAGNACIFAYTESSQGTTCVAHDDTNLAKVSGLAFTPDGTLLAGSRAQSAICTIDLYSGKITPFLTGLEDQPECLLVVPT